MKLLFCKPKYIGDTLLMTGTLAAVKRALPDAEIHVVVREGTEGILEGCAAIAKRHTLSKDKNFKSDLAVIRRLRRERFDAVFELGDSDRGRIVALLAGAARRYANTHPIHMRSGFWRMLFGKRVSENYNSPGIPRALWDYRTAAAALPLPPATEARPVFAKEAADFETARTLVRGRPTLFVHPVASVAANRWDAARWSAFIDARTARFDVVLSSGPAPHEIAYVGEILAGVADRKAVRFTGGRLDWRAMAGVLYSSAAYIGADTAAMHLASACGIPILAVFGRNAPEHIVQWKPVGEDVRVVTFGSGENGIADIPPERVEAAFETLFPISRHV